MSFKIVPAVKENHTNNVIGLQVYRDRIISCSFDNTIKIWDLNTYNCLQTLKYDKECDKKHDDERVHSVVFYEDIIVSGSMEGSIKIWGPNPVKLDEYICLRKLSSVHSNRISSVKVYKYNETNCIVSCSYDNTIQIFNLNTGASVRILREVHTNTISSIALYEKNGEPRIVSGSDDKTVKIWDHNTGECIRTLEGHIYAVTSVAVYKKDIEHRIVSGSWDKTIKIWDPNTGRCLTTITDRTMIESISVHETPDGGCFILSTSDDSISVRHTNIERLYNWYRNECEQLLYPNYEAIVPRLTFFVHNYKKFLMMFV